jgi:hypothetical protein
MLICVVMTAITGLGLGYTAYGMSRVVRGTGDPGELLVLAGVVIVLFLVWRGLGIRQRLKAYAAAGELAPGAGLASDPQIVLEDEPPPRPKPGAAASRKAA